MLFPLGEVLQRTPRAKPRYTTPMQPFSAVKVFSATMARDRELLGERITAWLRAHPELQLVDRVLTQTSDNEFHCFTVTLFLAGDAARYLAEVPVPFRSAVVPRAGH